MLSKIASVGGLTLVSRIFGFLRDILTARLIGAGPIADAFFVAFRLPNHFRALLAEGAFNAAFVPLFNQVSTQNGINKARQFAEHLLAILLVGQLILLVLIELFMPWFIKAFAYGFSADPAKFALTVTFTKITMPYLLLISLVALLGAVLNSVGKFTAAAAAPILMNVCFIVAQLGLLKFMPTAGHALAWAVFASGVVQFLYLSYEARRHKVGLALRWPRFGADVKQFFRRFGPAAFGAGLTQINLLLDTTIASLLPTGAVSYLYYADRLNQLPLGVIGIAVGTVLLPDLSRALAEGDQTRAIANQNRALEWTFFASLPAAMIFLLASRPIIETLFQTGMFTTADTAATTQTLHAYAYGLPAFVAIRAVLPGFYARGDTKTPVRIALIATLVNVAIKLALMRSLAQVGLAIATSVAAWINFSLLLFMLVRNRQFHWDAGLRRSIPLLLLATFILGAILLALQAPLASWFAVPDLVQRYAGLTILLGLPGTGFFAAVYLLNIAGMKDLVRLTLRRQPVR